MIFGYNGRDGVVTDHNGLIYMRARYYAPELRRFLNADILKGQISDSTSLNRYSYVNGNPISFVDPFGLSKDDRNSKGDADINYPIAVLVTRFKEEGLKYVGHTQLYFYNKTEDTWYCAEFTSSGGDSLKERKMNAKVYWGKKALPSGEDMAGYPDEGIGYTYLYGDFEKSVSLAKQYARGSYGQYNFLFHNCADYTNELLDVANIDGMFSQIASEGNHWISIPVLRELDLSISNKMDSAINEISDGLITKGKSISGSNLIGDLAGGALIGAGEFIDASTNFVGDVVDIATGIKGEAIDFVKMVATAITNPIADAFLTLQEQRSS